MSYYRVFPSEDSEDAWVLDIKNEFADGRPIDVWAYSRCERITDTHPVPVAVVSEGKQIDFNRVVGGIVVSRRLAYLIQSLAGNSIQRIHVSVDAPGDWEIINVLSCVDCIDYQRSTLTRWPQDHPEKSGKPRMVVNLVIDEAKTHGLHILRPKDWTVEVVVSDDLRRLLEFNNISGIDFIPASEGSP